MRYMATPSYPSRTLGVFKCKWTIKRLDLPHHGSFNTRFRGEGPLLKLIFSTIDFECNGLNPKVKSWGTANHVQITDKGNVKTISCGKQQEEAYYTNSDEIDVEIQVLDLSIFLSFTFDHSGQHCWLWQTRFQSSNYLPNCKSERASNSPAA